MTTVRRADLRFCILQSLLSTSEAATLHLFALMLTLGGTNLSHTLIASLQWHHWGFIHGPPSSAYIWYIGLLTNARKYLKIIDAVCLLRLINSCELVSTCNPLWEFRAKPPHAVIQEVNSSSPPGDDAMSQFNPHMFKTLAWTGREALSYEDAHIKHQELKKHSHSKNYYNAHRLLYSNMKFWVSVTQYHAENLQSGVTACQIVLKQNLYMDKNTEDQETLDSDLWSVFLLSRPWSSIGIWDGGTWSRPLVWEESGIWNPSSTYIHFSSSPSSSFSIVVPSS